jgi:hypothetical protein
VGLLDLLQLLLGERKGASPAPIERDAERARHRAIVRDHLASSALLRSSEVEAGRVGLEGRAIARARLTAPGSGTPVIGYRLRLARCLPGGELEPILDVSEVAAFALDDGGPTLCEVRPLRCLPLLAAELPLLVEGQALLRQPFAALLDRHAMASARLRTGDRYRVTEHLLEEGETVFVFGVARRELDVAGSGALYRGALFRLVVDPPEGGLLVVADRGRDALLEALASSEDFVPDW